MLWRVPNKMERRKELIGFYVFMKSFTAGLVLQIVIWGNRDAKEPLTPENNNNNYNKEPTIGNKANTH